MAESHIHRIPLDENTPVSLDNEWLTPDEVEERNRAQSRQRVLRHSLNPTNTPSLSTQVIPSPTTPSTGSTADNTTTLVSPDSLPTPTLASSQTLSSNIIVDASLPPRFQLASPLPSAPPAPPSTQPPPLLLRRSDRTNKGTYSSTRFINQAFLTSICDPHRPHQETSLAYMATLETDLETGEENCLDPHAYAAKHNIKDPDNPSYNDALTGPHAAEYESAMIKEIRQLLKQRTWTSVTRASVPPASDGTARPILKGTWAFKLKRLPDGTPLKFKARYCVRGDLQREGIDYFETYAPVVQWLTVRLLLTLILSNNWTTKQVDYTNAFAQADLKEEVYIESPRGFTRKDKKDLILKLCKSLYGLKQAPRTFFEKLRAGLLERGFTQSVLDPCLFMKENMICAVYVDDTIIAGPDSDKIESLISSLGVAKDEQRHTFELRDEGEVGDFLGIRIEKGPNNSFILSKWINQ